MRTFSPFGHFVLRIWDLHQIWRPAYLYLQTYRPCRLGELVAVSVMNTNNVCKEYTQSTMCYARRSTWHTCRSFMAENMFPTFASCVEILFYIRSDATSGLCRLTEPYIVQSQMSVSKRRFWLLLNSQRQCLPELLWKISDRSPIRWLARLSSFRPSGICWGHALIKMCQNAQQL